MEKLKIEISTKSIIKIMAVILVGWFLYLVRDIIILFFIALIIVSAIDSTVDWLQKKKIPRSVGVSIIYLFLIIVTSLAVSFLIPPIAHQFSDFSQNFPAYYQKTEHLLGTTSNFFQSKHINVTTQNLFDNISNWISHIPQNLFSTTIGVFSGLVSVVSVLSIAFYMAVEEDGINKLIASVTPSKYQKYIVDLSTRIKYKIGKWMQGQISLMLIVFILDYIGLSLAGIPYALALAVIAGLLEIIPYIGPIISAVPGAILGFLISPIKGILAILVYFIVQQTESNVLTPLIMKKAVGLNPAVVIIVLLIGAKLAGITGAILAVPIATAIGLFIRDLFFKENQKN